MANNKTEYRQNEKGGWDFYFNDEEFGITFWLPEGYKPEDYRLKFDTDDVRGAIPRKCHNVNIEVLNTPDDVISLSFDKYAGAHFVDNLMICVKEGLSLEFNENTLLGSSVPHSPDGFRRVYVDYFTFHNNYNVDVVFKEPGSTAPVNELDKKDMPINTFNWVMTENKNINFTVLANRGLLTFSNNIYVPTRENNYQRLRVTSNADHFGFVSNNIYLKSTKEEDIDKKRPAELNFNAEAALWSESKLEVLGVNTITMESPSSSKPAILKGSKVEGFFSDADLNLACKRAKLTGSSKVSLNLFGYSNLKANGNIAIEATRENTSLYKAKIENKNGPLNIFDSKLESVNAEFDMKKGIVASIKESRIKASTITNQNSSIIKSDFANTTMDGCTFGEGSYLELAKKTEIKYISNNKAGNEFKDISYTIKNVELKEKSSIKTVFAVDCSKELEYKEPDGNRHITISNVIATGSNSIQRFVPTSINNSLLNDILMFNYHPDLTINNSIIGNTVSLTNITAVEGSDLDGSQIDSSTPVKIEDESISNKTIKDYAKHIANKNKDSLYKQDADSSLELL